MKLKLFWATASLLKRGFFALGAAFLSIQLTAAAQTHAGARLFKAPSPLSRS